jgi:hypothetical protein
VVEAFLNVHSSSVQNARALHPKNTRAFDNEMWPVLSFDTTLHDIVHVLVNSLIYLFHGICVSALTQAIVKLRNAIAMLYDPHIPPST